MGAVFNDIQLGGPSPVAKDDTTRPRDFVRALVAADVARGKNGGKVVTRFPAIISSTHITPSRV